MGHTSNHTFTTVLAVLTVIVLSGCSQKRDPQPELSVVTGVVKLGGKPLPNATIAFHPLVTGDSSFGRTNEQGEYSLTYSGGKPGAVFGEHRVEISTRREAVDKEGNVIADDPELVPARYNSNSNLTTQVNLPQQSIDFELNTK